MSARRRAFLTIVPEFDELAIHLDGSPPGASRTWWR
jgi:hypothetical protein